MVDTLGGRVIGALLAATSMLAAACGGATETSAPAGSGGRTDTAQASDLKSLIPSFFQEDPIQVETTYVGPAADGETYVALVVTEDQLLGYVCDGASKWDWLSGPRTGNHFELASDKGTVLTGTIGDRIQGALTWRAGAPVSFVLDEASGISGLFRMPDFPEPGFVAGWIVAKGFGLRGVSAGEEGGIKGGLAVDEPPTGQPAGETPPPGTGGAGTDEVPLESCAQIGDLIDLLVAAMAGKTVDTEGKPIQPTKLMLNGMRRQLEEAMHKYNQQDC